MKPIALDVPYPNTFDMQQDIRSGQIISFAYATQDGEINATLQYVYQSVIFGKIDKDDADTLEGIAVAEMVHVKLLASAMLSLGVMPVYTVRPNCNEFYNACTVSRACTPQKMLMDDIQGELQAIAEYKKMLFVLKNEQVEALIQRIILDEKLHLETLKKMLEKYTQSSR